MKRTFLLTLILALAAYILVSSAQAELEAPKVAYEKGRVISAIYVDDQLYTQQVKFEVLSGKFRGKVVSISHMPTSMAGGTMRLKEGDKVVLYVEENPPKTESPDGSPIIQVSDFERDFPLLWLALSFALLMLLIGRSKGAKSLLGLTLTVLAVFFILIPLILKGFNPIAVTCVVSGIVSLLVFRIVGGSNLKSLSGATGTLLGVTAAGLIAFFAGQFMNLTGVSSEESRILLYSLKLNIDYRGILFSGIIIGAMGAIMDVGMSIASAIEEVHRVRPTSTMGELFTSGMNVGKDVMGTMSNTLILAYVGAALPLILLFISAEIPLVKIVNMELIADEVLRALSGSIGLILCIPITAFISAFAFSAHWKQHD